MTDIFKYWVKPDFIGNPVPHLSIYNGKDPVFAEKIFVQLAQIRPVFAFDVEGIDVINSSGQRRMDLRQAVDVSCIDETKGMNLDYIAHLSADERLRIAALALKQCTES
jgi:hypothetical protein